MSCATCGFKKNCLLFIVAITLHSPGLMPALINAVVTVVLCSDCDHRGSYVFVYS